MATVGSMTVRIEATATKALATFRTVLSKTKSLKDAIKNVGNIKVGEGKLLSKGNVLGFARAVSQEFANVIGDIRRLNEEAEKAGQTIEQFTKGAYTQEDVRKAEEFAAAMEKLKFAFDGTIKDLVIDIAPEATEAIKGLVYVVKYGAHLFRGGRKVSREFGEGFGNMLFGDGSKGAISREEIEANARRSPRPRPPAIAPPQPTVIPENQRQVAAAEKTNMLLDKLISATQDVPAPIEFREAKLAL